MGPKPVMKLWRQTPTKHLALPLFGASGGGGGGGGVRDFLKHGQILGRTVLRIYFDIRRKRRFSN